MIEKSSSYSQHRCYMTYTDKDSEVRIYARNDKQLAKGEEDWTNMIQEIEDNSGEFKIEFNPQTIATD